MGYGDKNYEKSDETHEYPDPVSTKFYKINNTKTLVRCKLRSKTTSIQTF